MSSDAVVLAVLAVLMVLYLAVAVVALAQFVRICLRVGNECSTPKLFFLLCFCSNFVRAVFFGWTLAVGAHSPSDTVTFVHLLFYMLNGLPNVLFFMTYTLLVVFWAEIYHHAHGMASKRALRLTCMVVNGVAVCAQVTMWVLAAMAILETKLMSDIMEWFYSVLFILAGIGFLIYGGRMYAMLAQIRVENDVKRNKLREIGWVSVICTSCFLLRAVVIIGSTYEPWMKDSTWVILCYFLGFEIIPSSLVLYLLRKLPSPHRAMYTPIADGPANLGPLNPMHSPLAMKGEQQQQQQQKQQLIA